MSLIRARTLKDEITNDVDCCQIDGEPNGRRQWLPHTTLISLALIKIRKLSKLNIPSPCKNKK